MKKMLNRGILPVVFVLIAMATFVSAKEETSKLQGWKPYTPTRLEWLAMEMNAECRVDLTLDSRYSIQFVPIENEDAIMIAVNYYPNVNRELMNVNINGVKELILRKAKYYRWSSWLKVKERVEMIKPK